MLNLLYLRPGDNSMSFHTFPSHMPRKRQWEIALKMGKKTPRNAVVCSFHFQDTDFVLSQKSNINQFNTSDFYLSIFIK